MPRLYSLAHQLPYKLSAWLLLCSSPHRHKCHSHPGQTLVRVRKHGAGSEPRTQRNTGCGSKVPVLQKDCRTVHCNTCIKTLRATFAQGHAGPEPLHCAASRHVSPAPGHASGRTCYERPPMQPGSRWGPGGCLFPWQPSCMPRCPQAGHSQTS